MPDCPDWSYRFLPGGGKQERPGYPDAIKASLRKILPAIRTRPDARSAIANDSRPSHRALFCSLTDAGFEYFAGNFRGSEHECLRFYRVEVGAIEGSLPEKVLADMERFTTGIRSGTTHCRIAFDSAGWILSPEQKLLLVVEFTAYAFVRFLQIHPYADGNGHIARLLTWALLSEFGYWPQTWPIDPRPPEPYAELIRKYESGDRAPLVRRILQSLCKG